jgi:hypothetical protein
MRAFRILNRRYRAGIITITFLMVFDSITEEIAVIDI